MGLNTIVMVNMIGYESEPDDNELMVTQTMRSDIDNSAIAHRLPSRNRSRSLDAGREAMLFILGWQYNVHAYDDEGYDDT